MTINDTRTLVESKILWNFLINLKNVSIFQLFTYIRNNLKYHCRLCVYNNSKKTTCTRLPVSFLNTYKTRVHVYTMYTNELQEMSVLIAYQHGHTYTNKCDAIVMRNVSWALSSHSVLSFSSFQKKIAPPQLNGQFKNFIRVALTSICV